MKSPGGISDRQNGRMSQRDFMSTVVATAVPIGAYRIGTTYHLKASVHCLANMN